eukprot:7378582-Prymnesium_polylepis.1
MARWEGHARGNGSLHLSRAAKKSKGTPGPRGWGGGGRAAVRLDAHRDAHLREDVVKLRVRAAVQVAARNDVVARLREVDDRVEDRRSARRQAQASERVRTLEHADALLEHVGRRIHQPRVDVAQLLQREQLGRVLGRLEDVGRRAVDGHAARGGRVGPVAGVEAQRVERRVLARDLAVVHRQAVAGSHARRVVPRSGCDCALGVRSAAELMMPLQPIRPY